MISFGPNYKGSPTFQKGQLREGVGRKSINVTNTRTRVCYIEKETEMKLETFNSKSPFSTFYIERLELRILPLQSLQVFDHLGGNFRP